MSYLAFHLDSVKRTLFSLPPYHHGTFSRELILLAPPYDVPVRTTLNDLGHLSPGTLLGIRAGDPREVEDVLLHLAGVRRTFIDCSLFAVVPELGEWQLDFALRAGATGVRAVITSLDCAKHSLRARMAEVDLPSAVPEWLRVTTNGRLKPAADAAVRSLLTASGGSRRLNAFTRGEAEQRRLRRVFKHARLPPPAQWVGLGRALQALLALQVDVGQSVLRVAHEQGYADHSCLTQQFKRYFGVTPSEARTLMGWEWAIMRWLDRPFRVARTCET